MEWNLDIPALMKGAITTAFIILATIVVMVVLSRALNSLERHSRISKRRLIPLRLSLRYGIIIVALLLSLSAFGIPIGNFWTFLSALLGLIAIGFVAVWSVLSNISATFFLFIFRPFDVGNYIKVIGDDVNGEVVNMNFMFTTLRNRKGDVFCVPNNHFFQKTTLRPADPEALESPPNQTEAGNAEKAIDHSQQNLAGIDLHPEGRPHR